MAVDGEGIEELVEGEDPGYLRFCPIHRLPHSPDSRIYRGAGRLCPRGGEPLVGYLARFRDDQGLPMDPGPFEDDWL